MDFYRLLDATAFAASLAVIAVGVWCCIVHVRKGQPGPRWINPVFYVGQVILTADAWLNPNPLWIRIVHATGLSLLTVLHLIRWYTRWESREREKAYRELTQDLDG